jgi:hypothetical protein
MAAILLSAKITAIASDQALPQTETNAPQAVVNEKTYSFKEALEGDVVSHAFSIANTGKTPLKIIDVRTSCGCTTAKRPEEISPGAQDVIVVQARTAGFGGHHFKKHIRVETNDPKQKRIVLTIQGQVTRFANIEPRRIALLGRTEETLQAKATITPESKYPFHIVEIVSDDALSGKISVRMEQQKGIYLVIVNNLMTRPGKYSGRILLKTDNPRRPELTLYVIGRITS